AARYAVRQHSTFVRALSTDSVLDTFHPRWWGTFFGCSRRLSKWCLRNSQGRTQRSRQLRGRAMSHVMHVHNCRAFFEKMVVHCSDLKARRTEFCHDWIQFILKQYQIAHHHRVVIGSEKRRPRTERESGLNCYSVNRNM